MNLLGQDNLTIAGSYLPWDLTRSPVEITFNDVKNTPCIPQVSNTSHLVCLTNGFDMSQAGQTFGVNIAINNVTVENTLSFSLMTAKKSGVLLTPDSASPVLKTMLNITLESTFPYTMNDPADFSANATNISNPEYFRQMNVLAVDDATKTLSVIFGGAWSGSYSISVRHR